MTLDAKLIRLTPEAWQLIDAARGDASRAEFIETMLWTKLRKVASDADLTRPVRRGPGQYERNPK